jgi:hypothetical protein
VLSSGASHDSSTAMALQRLAMDEMQRGAWGCHAAHWRRRIGREEGKLGLGGGRHFLKDAAGLSSDGGGMGATPRPGVGEGPGAACAAAAGRQEPGIGGREWATAPTRRTGTCPLGQGRGRR